MMKIANLIAVFNQAEIGLEKKAAKVYNKAIVPDRKSAFRVTMQFTYVPADFTINQGRKVLDLQAAGF